MWAPLVAAAKSSARRVRLMVSSSTSTSWAKLSSFGGRDVDDAQKDVELAVLVLFGFAEFFLELDLRGHVAHGDEDAGDAFAIHDAAEAEAEVAMDEAAGGVRKVDLDVGERVDLKDGLLLAVGVEEEADVVLRGVEHLLREEALEKIQEAQAGELLLAEDGEEFAGVVLADDALGVDEEKAFLHGFHDAIGLRFGGGERRALRRELGVGGFE